MDELITEQHRRVAFTRPLTLEEAAEWFHIHPETLRGAASRGDVPAAHRFGRWYFWIPDLVNFLRVAYPEQWQAAQGRTEEEVLWQNKANTTDSGPEGKRAYSGLISRDQAVRESAAALARGTGTRHGNCETRSKRKPGESPSSANDQSIAFQKKNLAF